MEDLALHTFTVGLHPRLSQIVRCRDPDSLNSAVGFAVAEEKILSASYRKVALPNSNYAERTKFTPKRDFQTQLHRLRNTQNPRPDFTRKINTGDLVCRYCKNIGHAIENCRKRQYNNSRYQPNTPTPNNLPQNPPHRTFTVDCSDDTGVDEVDHKEHLNY
ncbi:unnamed protein product [Arctia plantaginis]|uniref:Uncharacterized protein n=1 Tax=Arctia plantaginis TaxID=874455 RepID=A0A8S1AED1_ARCPL|nr:unnamed protein product [Arctia plantaginis]